jgi:ubiquinone/menaquinone biosynthesis C-methylase UbiE
MKEKILVKNFWNKASCGEELYLHGDSEKAAFISQSKKRYELESYIVNFADFASTKNKKVLEIGVGLGADHQCFAEAGAHLYVIDLTERAILNTKKRMELFNLVSDLNIGDAENLIYEDNIYDIVYSWGVIHHSPNTHLAVNEIFRVLNPGATAKIMIYHKYSFVGYMLWFRYGLLKFNPFLSLKEIYSNYLESPGTKAYTVNEAKQLFENFSKVEISTVLTHGDLLSSDAGQRHKGILLNIAKAIFPRFFIKLLFPGHGLFMLIKATK